MMNCRKIERKNKKTWDNIDGVLFLEQRATNNTKFSFSIDFEIEQQFHNYYLS